MTPRLLRIALVALVALAASTDARAQFETPNLSFHNATAFPLVGKHLSVPCERCHENGQFRGTPRTCYECHWVRRKDDKYQTRLGTQCQQCHTPLSWAPARWDHTAQAGVMLNIDHRQLGCAQCHQSANFTAGTANCVACHQKDYQATTAPNHAAAGFPVACDACHSPGDSSWQNMGGRGFNHSAFFPLVGIHATLACNACHKNNVYRGLSRDCFGCHRANYLSAQNPNHVAAGFPTTCDTCHRATDTSWMQAHFAHTWFPLVANHNVQCMQCHTSSSNFAVFTCTTCHDRGSTDNHHRGVNGYRYDSNACYACHPTGRGN